MTLANELRQISKNIPLEKPDEKLIERAKTAAKNLETSIYWGLKLNMSNIAWLMKEGFTIKYDGVTYTISW